MALARIADQEDVTHTQCTQGLCGDLGQLSLVRGFEESRGVQIDSQGKLKLGKSRSVLQLQADHTLWVERRGLPQEVHGRGKAAGTILFPVQIVHLVTGT
jgi:hypothetical protein